MRAFISRMIFNFYDGDYMVIDFAAAKARRSTAACTKIEILDKKIARALEYRRSKLKIQRAHVANYMGVPVSYIHAYEGGKSSISATHLALYLRALKIEAQEFFDDILQAVS